MERLQQREQSYCQREANASADLENSDIALVPPSAPAALGDRSTDSEAGEEIILI